MSKINYNYHSHTYLCGHAIGEPTEYVLKAVELGYKNIGISEHAPMPNLINRNLRLNIEDYDLYFKLLEEAKTIALRNNLNFYKGFEIEYFHDLNVYEKYLSDVDYLILGQHFIIRDGEIKSSYRLSDLEDIKIYAETIVDAINTGYFNLVCHPELCFYNIKEPTDEMYEELRKIIIAAKEKDIPIEINANGVRKAVNQDNCHDFHCLRYPKYKFLQMVKELNAKVHISSDAHSPDALYDFAMDRALELAKELDLNLVDELKMNYFK